ncbi:MAG: type II secretion system major pseudopilin GspG [Sedimentisphaerales bacterium]|nr:type II secretion system major pseudopilin GspG [Sedimentisphaerales bacterium]
MEAKREKRKQVRSGFTMIELVAMLIIIGLLAAVVGTNVMGKIEKAKVTTTKTSLKILHSAVNTLKMDTGRYPTDEEGLSVLVEDPGDEGWEPGGYLETLEIPPDGWKNDFVYELEPASGKPFVIISYGADGEEGGEGYNADLYSTDAF